MNTALLFPGQGEQQPGMLHALPPHPAFSRTLAEISAVLGTDVRALDTAEALRSNAATQLALFAAAISTHRLLTELGVRADYVAGHSVGAFAAAVACGALELTDAARLVALRGRRMEEAYPSGYGMGVVLGLDESTVARLAFAASTHAEPVYASNVNAPRQITVSGADAAVERVLTAALAHGAFKARRLAVSVPAHCPLMRPVADALADALAAVEMRRPAVPFAGNRTGRTLRTADAVRDDLVHGVALPVRWHEATSVLYERGARLFVQTAPGDSLVRLAQAMLPGVRTASLRETSAEHIHDLALHREQLNKED
ncbi:ACP S-malonyltransferase [Streptomyces umbrinus]|uniref:ACP S-malonyltransferase n=1 Tax=Streptomyces umbrinus TaxID=67370 RepID=UPI003C2D9C14